MGRIWFTAWAGKLGLSTVFGRMGEQIAQEDDNEDRSVLTVQLPEAEIGQEARRAAAEEYKRAHPGTD